VKSLHRVRSRGAVGSAAVDLHIQVSPEQTLQQANTIADEVRNRLLALDGITDVTVHMEAQRDPNTAAADIFTTLRYTAAGLGLTVHEAWVHSTEGSLTIEMHVGVKPELTLAEAHGLVSKLEGEIRARLPDVQGVHTHIELADAHIQEFDRAPGDVERRVRREVERAAAGIPALETVRNIAVRRDHGGNGKLFVSLDCTVRPDLPVTQAHDLATQLERELNRRLNTAAEVSIHVEPAE
jgi:divalent metal cation (Fe/Co/Zn/Cd) transporter